MPFSIEVRMTAMTVPSSLHSLQSTSYKIYLFSPGVARLVSSGLTFSMKVGNGIRSCPALMLLYLG
jgi:hypothetical protein